MSLFLHLTAAFAAATAAATTTIDPAPAPEAASVSETTFAFVGQPPCVELSYADGITQLTNTCEHALLLDQSVQLPAGGQQARLVPADTSTQIKDLNAFTLGMDGQLYRVLAVVNAPPEPVAI
jgi:hypothetical protein